MIITRRFILAAAAFSASLSNGAASSVVPVGLFSDTTSRLRELVPAASSAREIGRIYLARHPEEHATAVLTRLILSSMSLDESDVVALDRETLHAMVTSRIRADFGQGYTDKIGGWILSQTEARLCSLCT